MIIIIDIIAIKLADLKVQFHIYIDRYTKIEQIRIKLQKFQFFFLQKVHIMDYEKL